MTAIIFRGYKITPDSYQDGDMPGAWFPYATVEKEGAWGGQVALPPQLGICRSIANTAAILEAKRRIVSGIL